MNRGIAAWIVVGLVAGLGSACRIVEIEGDGSAGITNRRLAIFDSIAAATLVDVEVTMGAQAEVELRCDGNLLDHIATRVVDRELQIGVVDELPETAVILRPTRRCEARVQATRLEKAANAGSGKLEIVDTFSEFERAENVGSGPLYAAAVEAQDLVVEIAGSGPVQLAGQARHLRVESVGSGALLASSLRTVTADVSLLGSGDAAVRASECVSIQLLGSGSLTVSGDPEICGIENLGSGRVVFE